ncbi:hypothetical protein L1887_32087 [Cichorium endivia]|nr:hypothetical protein L1887_32087 [Cichorium endivia]
MPYCISQVFLYKARLGITWPKQLNAPLEVVDPEIADIIDLQKVRQWKIAIGTDDVYKTAEAVKHFGRKITTEPGPPPGISTKITARLDPDGWKTVSYM